MDRIIDQNMVEEINEMAKESGQELNLNLTDNYSYSVLDGVPRLTDEQDFELKPRVEKAFKIAHKNELDLINDLKIPYRTVNQPKTRT